MYIISWPPSNCIPSVYLAGFFLSEIKRIPFRVPIVIYRELIRLVSRGVICSRLVIEQAVACSAMKKEVLSNAKMKFYVEYCFNAVLLN